MRQERANDGLRETMVFRADIKYLGTALAFVKDLMQRAGASAGTIDCVELAVEEIFVNIALYAYTESAGEEMKIHFSAGPETVFLEFEDNGPPFDPLSRDDPDTTVSAKEREIGGLGIFIVKNVMDSVEYRRDGDRNFLRMSKAL
jgi:sigma-B regulation protein RsbU (phosphoserine phosphatase)